MPPGSSVGTRPKRVIYLEGAERKPQDVVIKSISDPKQLSKNFAGNSGGTFNVK